MKTVTFNPIDQRSLEGEESKCGDIRMNHLPNNETKKKKKRRKTQQSVKGLWEKEEAKKKRYEETNKMWGDNPDEKGSHDIRITSTNINGFASTGEVSEYIIASAQFESDINCFQEVNLNTRKGEVVQEMKKAIRDVETINGSTFQTSCQMETTQEKRTRGKKKQGGTMIHVDRRWSGSSLKKYHDSIGRWSKITMEGRGQRKLTIYSVYRVNDNTLENAGGETVWLQEYNSLLQRGHKDPNPRKQILQDLKSDILQTKTDKSHQVIVCIDANESTRKKNSNIQQFMEDTGLVDCHQHNHPHLNETPTHAEGSSQIDYCFVSPDLLPHVQRCGITALHYAVQGADHCSLWVDLDAQGVFGGKVNIPQGIPTRGLKLRNIQALKIFKTQLESYVKQHRMMEKISGITLGLKKIDQTQDEVSKAETMQRWINELDKWDELMMCLMLAVERKCSRTGLTRTYLWSRPLMLAGQRITYWKARKRASTRNGEDDNLQGYALHLHRKFGVGTNNHGYEEIKNELKEAWKHLCEIQQDDRVNREVFLEALAVERAKQQNTSVESAIKQMKNAEASLNSHKKFNHTLKRTSKGAIDFIMIPDGKDPNGPFGKKWKKVMDTEEVENLILQQNETKLMESSISPFSTTSGTTISADLVPRLARTK